MTTQRKQMQVSLPFLHCLQACMVNHDCSRGATFKPELCACIAEIMPPKQ